MQMSISILTIGALQLLLFIAAVYIASSLRMYNVRFSGIDILILIVQTANLIMLLQSVLKYEGSYALLLIAQGIIICSLSLRFIWLLRRRSEYRRKRLMPPSIREAIDYLPGGICFANPNGMPILTNCKMNELLYRLTGHTMMDAQLTWNELYAIDSARDCKRLDEPWITRDYVGDIAGDGIFFSFPDGSVWRFQREELKDNNPHYIQLEATDISELYRYSKELYENNLRLSEQYERQQRLLANIVEINHEKEILSMKMRIHDDLGRSILTTKQHLLSGTIFENTSVLTELWNTTIRCLEDYTQAYLDAGDSPEVELQKAADMIGCRINFYGERPVGRKTTLLFYAAVREGLANAVRHAAADELSVAIKPTVRGYHIEISDNGKNSMPPLVEGNGLSNLRRKLEQNGATFDIKYNDGVVLIVELPLEG